MPILPMTKAGHLRQLFMLRIILSVFQFRVNKRWVGVCACAVGLRGELSGQECSGPKGGPHLTQFHAWVSRGEQE